MTSGQKIKRQLRTWSTSRARAHLACALALLAGCSEELPPVSVIEFMENPRTLEATMVRCGQNRSETKYEAECVNAREAVNRLASAEQEERRQRLEAQSQRKRQALRRTQEAAAEARRRALEAQRLREEAEYLGLFEETPAEQSSNRTTGEPNAQPQFQSPAPSNVAEMNSVGDNPVVNRPVGGSPPSQASTVDEPVTATEDNTPQSDLAAIREELQRRRDNPE